MSKLIKEGVMGEVLHIATLQKKKITNTPSLQENSTKHCHHNTYFYPHELYIYTWHNHFYTLTILLFFV